MDTTPAMAHLSDGDLIRHIDREGGADEHARREAHLRTCPACSGRAARLEAGSHDVGEWLARADHEHRPAAPPRPRRRADVTPWLRAAAIVLLLAAPLAAVPPVRHWVAEQIGLATETDPQVAAAQAAPVIRFAPAPGTFTVRLDASAADATLAIGRAEGADAVLEGAAGGDAPPVVSQDELRLEPVAGRRYALRLPATVRTAVILADGRALRLGAASIDTGSVVPLSVNR